MTVDSPLSPECNQTCGSTKIRFAVSFVDSREKKSNKSNSNLVLPSPSPGSSDLLCFRPVARSALCTFTHTMHICRFLNDCTRGNCFDCNESILLVTLAVARCDLVRSEGGWEGSLGVKRQNLSQHQLFAASGLLNLMWVELLSQHITTNIKFTINNWQQHGLQISNFDVRSRSSKKASKSIVGVPMSQCLWANRVGEPWHSIKKNQRRDLMFGDIWRFFLCTAEKKRQPSQKCRANERRDFHLCYKQILVVKIRLLICERFLCLNWILLRRLGCRRGPAAQSASAASQRTSASSINPRTDFLLTPIDMQNSEALAAHLISALHCHSEFLSRREWKYFCGSRAGANQRENN